MLGFLSRNQIFTSCSFPKACGAENLCTYIRSYVLLDFPKKYYRSNLWMALFLLVSYYHRSFLMFFVNKPVCIWWKWLKARYFLIFFTWFSVLLKRLEMSYAMGFFASSGTGILLTSMFIKESSSINLWLVTVVAGDGLFSCSICWDILNQEQLRFVFQLTWVHRSKQPFEFFEIFLREFYHLPVFW